jgi:anaerobic magnesium-protoporphyrin IX monomethyl ester cyclase
LKRDLKPDRIWFSDDIFGLQPRWVVEFAEQVEARDAAIPFKIQSRIDLMTERAVTGLARAGCAEVWLGVESGSQKVLDAMDKGTDVRLVPVVRERLRRAGIRACYFLQLGYAGETFADLMATVQLVRDTLPDDIGVSVSYPLPGTRFHQMVRDELGGKDHWQDSDDLAMMFQGTYQTPFYRHLHRLLHRELRLRQGDPAELAGGLDALCADWLELGRLEAGCRSEKPTTLATHREAPAAPDLSKRWS